MTDIPALDPEAEENFSPSETEETLAEQHAPTAKKRSKWTTIFRVVVIGIVIVVAGLWFMLNAEKPVMQQTFCKRL